MRSLLYFLGYLCNGWCGHYCEYVATFDQFAPEALCPIHDPDTRWEWVIRKVVLWLRPEKEAHTC
jgi:hypothetical protein